MKTPVDSKGYVRQVLNNNRFAVLATVNNNKPHACLIAVTVTDDLLQLLFATYKNTSKYTNLTQNENVCILFENRNDKKNSKQEITVLTAFGKATEIKTEHSDALNTQLLRHPELNTFLSSSNCAFFRVNVDAYQLVLGVDEIYWWKINS